MLRLKHSRELFTNLGPWWFLKVRVMSGVQTEMHVYKMQINVCLGTSKEWDDRGFPWYLLFPFHCHLTIERLSAS